MKSHEKNTFEEKYFQGWYKAAVGNFEPTDLRIAKNWFWAWLKKIEQYLPLQNGKGKSVLEIGCSIGAVANLLVEKGFDVTATDISKYAVKNAGKLTPKAKFKVLDIENIGSISKLYNYVICFEVVEHLAHPEKGISNMYKLLKKNGFVIISTPYPYSWNYGDPTHISVKYPIEWVMLLRNAGFRDIKYYKFTLLPFFYRFSKYFQIIIPFHIQIPKLNCPIIFIAKK